MVANQHSPKFMAYLLVKGEECGIIIKMYANFVIFEIYLTDWESGPIVESEMRTFSFQGM
jgi:hypothetical protein